MVIVGLRPSAADHTEQHRLAEDLVRDMTHRYIGLHGIEFLRDADGKPHVKDHPEVLFSISHSGGLAGCAMHVPACNAAPPPFPCDFPSILLSEGFAEAEFSLPDDTPLLSIGFDMEKFRQFDDRTSRRFYERYFSDAGESDPSSDRLIYLWTRLESRYKYVGSWKGEKPSVKGRFFSGRWIYLGEVYYFSVCLGIGE